MCVCVCVCVVCVCVHGVCVELVLLFCIIVYYFKGMYECVYAFVYDDGDDDDYDHY